jgi:lipoprotein-releasing system ATP-binding protein
VHGVVGPNGAGKTTLLRLIKGLLKPDKGTFSFTYRDKACPAQEAISRTGYFPQEPSLYPDLSVWEHLEFFRDLYDLDESDFHKRAEELLALMGLSDRADHKPNQLSGGEKQRVAVARALVNNPAVVLADEPSGSLDSKNKAELHQLFFELRDKLGQTFVIVTHDEELAKLTDRTIHMKDGVISE